MAAGKAFLGSDKVELRYETPRVTALGSVQNFVLGNGAAGPDGDPLADADAES